MRLKLCDNCKAEYVNLLRHEMKGLWFNRVQSIEAITGINYHSLQKIFKERAMEVFHQQARQWIETHRTPENKTN